MPRPLQYKHQHTIRNGDDVEEMLARRAAATGKAAALIIREILEKEAAADAESEQTNG